MENSTLANDNTNTLFQNTSSLNNTSSNNNSFFDYFKNMTFTTWILIIFILSFLGFNIFTYLAKGTQDITNIFKPLVDKVFGLFLLITGKTINVSAQGANDVVKGTADVLEKGLTEIENVTSPTSLNKNKSETVQPVQPTTSTSTNTNMNTLNKALNTSKSQQPSQPDYQASESSSTINSSNQTGWCFIGEDRGYRTCGQVGVNDKCMSGDIFPSQTLCINPNLRT